MANRTPNKPPLSFEPPPLEPVCTAKEMWHEYGLVATVILLCLVSIGLSLWPAIAPQIKTWQQSHATITEGDYVDEAWALPHTQAISAHRDLREIELQTVYGNVPEDFSITLCAPGIAIKTSRGWCVWVLGSCLDRHPSHSGDVVYKNVMKFHNWPLNLAVYANNVSFISSAQGYAEALKDFKSCAQSIGDIQ